MAKANKKIDDDIASLLAEDAGSGFEQAHADSFAKPALKILQKLSPECDEDSDEYVKGAKPGLIINTVTKELMEKVRVFPEIYYTTYGEWILRENGGGIVTEHGFEAGVQLERQCKIDEKKRRILPNGHQLSRTENYIVKMELDDGSFEVAIIRMSGSQISRAKKWNTQLRMSRIEAKPGVFVKPPLHAYQWELGTERQSNDQGNWMGWTFTRLGMLNSVELLTEIREDKELYNQNLLTFTPEDGAEIVEEENAL